MTATDGGCEVVRMTEEEADALDVEITNADITLKHGKGGIFTRQRELIDALDRVSADYILISARDATPSERREYEQN